MRLITNPSDYIIKYQFSKITIIDFSYLSTVETLMSSESELANPLLAWASVVWSGTPVSLTR